MKKPIIIIIFLVIGFASSFSQTINADSYYLKSDNFREDFAKSLVYPKIAQEMGISGQVTLLFRIDNTGCIDSVFVKESPDISLSKATISALNQFKCDWKPAEKTKEARDTWLSYSTYFMLGGDNNAYGDFNTLESAINNPTAVKFLYLVNDNLTEFPKEIISFRNLWTLDLQANMINTIPSEIQNCKKLTFLLLGNNNISKLPAEINNLKKLYKLDLSGNQIYNVPNEVYNFKKLWDLDLRDNNLTTISSEIQNLKSLRHLYLSYNNLNKLPEEIFQLPKLHTLDLKGNPFTELEIEKIRERFTYTKVIF